MGESFDDASIERTIRRRGRFSRPRGGLTRMLPDDVRALALMLPETVAGAHRGNPDFRVGGRVFATLWVEEARVVLRLSPSLQAALCAAEPDLFTPIAGAWGRRGWTSLDLDPCAEEILRDALLAAWRVTAPKTVADGYDLS